MGVLGDLVDVGNPHLRIDGIVAGPIQKRPGGLVLSQWLCCIERDRLSDGQAVRSEQANSQPMTGTVKVRGTEDLSSSDVPSQAARLNATVPLSQTI